MSEWMNKEGVKDPCNEILYSFKKGEKNPAICDIMNKPEGHYPDWKKPGTER